MKNLFKNFGILIVVFLLIVVLFSSFGDIGGDSNRVGMETFINQVNN